MPSARLSALVMAFAVAFLPACTSLEYQSDDSLPATVGKTIVVVPIVVGAFIFGGFAADVRHRSQQSLLNDELGHGETDYYREIY